MTFAMTEKEKQTAYKDKCPKCKTTWTKTPQIVSANLWWHCKKCEKKAEVICEEEKTTINPIDLTGWGTLFGEGLAVQTPTPQINPHCTQAIRSKEEVRKAHLDMVKSLKKKK